jgi:predicted nucleic acid-binding protein
MDAFDSDVLIYAAVADHPLGRRVRALLLADAAVGGDALPAGVGSVLLVPEVLVKLTRTGDEIAFRSLTALLGRLRLQPVDETIAELATALGAAYGLRAPDAVHLATAVIAGADRFITNNTGDFPKTITEIEVVYPADLDA